MATTASTAPSCLVFRGDPNCPLGSTFFVGTRRYRVVREINEAGRHAVMARPCAWYDGAEVAVAWITRTFATVVSRDRVAALRNRAQRTPSMPVLRLA